MTREPQYPPWGHATPTFWAHPDASPDQDKAPAGPDEQPPAEYQPRLQHIAHLAHDGRIGEAQGEAARLDEEVTARHGHAHDHTVNVRELRGHLAELADQHADATQWYLHTTAIRLAELGAHHPHTSASAKRAHSSWLRVTTPAEVHQTGERLLSMLQAIHGPDSATEQAVHQRLNATAPNPPA